jgi:hypothetical protein
VFLLRRLPNQVCPANLEGRFGPKPSRRRASRFRNELWLAAIALTIVIATLGIARAPRKMAT